MGRPLKAFLRPPEESDWLKILELANLSVAHVSDAPIQTEWLGHRRAFPGYQKHFVAERAGEVAGYGAVERGAEDAQASYRVFVVTPWSDDSNMAELLYLRVAVELENAGAQHAWLREYASDQLLIAAHVDAGGIRVRVGVIA